jgi:hypothetical protein
VLPSWPELTNGHFCSMTPQVPDGLDSGLITRRIIAEIMSSRIIRIAAGGSRSMLCVPPAQRQLGSRGSLGSMLCRLERRLPNAVPETPKILMLL